MTTTKHYVCISDFKHEENSLDYFSSIEELKNKKACWQECGVMEVELNESGEKISSREIIKSRFD